MRTKTLRIIYKLFAVIKHEGSLETGHYVSYSQHGANV